MPKSLLPIPLLTAPAMRSADQRTIEEYGIPGFTLMESAGRATVSEIERVFGPLANQRFFDLLWQRQ